ncbi:MAG: hypothetical protein IKL20_03385 [Alistipes sp.]|nr:hypothetical protein [Alistipes sp.]
MWLFILLICVLVGVVMGVAASNSSNADLSCMFGYDDFGCQPHCPLYDHCWKRE